ncbi:MAG: polysaccharide biosynthesis C-terminal domain-containing protein [Clostridiales Family XIII bacterium]|jgi:putative peptidoglycan lipid II flippase|nr:polysaccharide biosynthesis C-terminal domain-containing protein [Clostridiales Family XIII bacterium]
MKQLSAPKIALIVAALTLGSKLIGFVREIIKANYYGTTYVVDSLSISESIPTMIFAGILTAAATSFMPLFSDKMEKEGEVAANRYTSQAINILVIICVISSLVGILFSNQLVTLFTMPDVAAPESASAIQRVAWFVTHGWTGERAELAYLYVNVTFSYTLFSSVCGMLESYLKYKGVFIRQVLAGYTFSACIIIAIIASRIVDDPRLIVLGSLAGNIVRLVIIAMVARREKYRYTPDFRVTGTVRQIFALAMPIFIGSSVNQICTVVDNTLASGLATGNVASMQYSLLIVNTIVGITASVISMIIYPKMTQSISLGDNERFGELFTRGIAIMFIIGVPVALACFIYSNQVIQIVFERGMFSGASTELTGRAFMGFAPGVVFYMVSDYMIYSFYSRKQMKTPMFISLVAIAVNVSLDILLVGPLGNMGLALATSASYAVNATLLVLAFRKGHRELAGRGLANKFGKILLASVVSVGGTTPIYFGVMALARANSWIMPRMVLLGVTALVAVAVYALLLRAMKITEMGHFREMVGLFRRGDR